MSDRERLIELLAMTTTEQVFCTSSGEVVSRYWCRAVADEDVARVADELIANGVTVQKWVPASERLPKHGDIVLVRHKYGCSVFQWDDRAQGWVDDHDSYAKQYVTHWMPLPEPPKDGEA